MVNNGFIFLKIVRTVVEIHPQADLTCGKVALVRQDGGGEVQLKIDDRLAGNHPHLNKANRTSMLTEL